jgi:ABC-2 type transport system permease protein
VEVIKQGTAVMIYMFPNMFIGMAVMALLVYLGTLMPHNLIMLIAIPIVTVLALLSYKKVLKLASSR